jgi:hypothetical protein
MNLSHYNIRKKDFVLHSCLKIEEDIEKLSKKIYISYYYKIAGTYDVVLDLLFNF